ncbi:ATP-dependent DNA helicase RecG [Patescibacteria group bacterium]|nr:ATP-dependent DNA helicase RecG [Patescibacteria group bacterium]MCL5091874.1 ATP-dependent DNA helicase RecG [Patescibacteria group bacterium]
MDLQQSVASLPRTRPATINQLRALGIATLMDLLSHFPSRYEDYQRVSAIARCQVGETLTLKGYVRRGQPLFTKTGLRLERFLLEDDSGTISAIWYNQPYLLRLLYPGVCVSVAGTVKLFGRDRTMIAGGFEIIVDPQAPTLHTGRIVPVYPETARLSSKTIREKLFPLLKDLTLSDWLPEPIRNYNGLTDIVSAYRQIHFPDSQTQYQAARRTLAFHELFLLQLHSSLTKQSWQRQALKQPFSLLPDQAARLKQMINALPFSLTPAQQRCFREVQTDLLQPFPMNRLLQGDVGAGKTVVAALAAYLTYLNGKTSLIMAPTAILAEQHYQALHRLFAGVDPPLRLGLYTGATKTTRTEPRYDVLVGTQALLNFQAGRTAPGLVVIDEQHRFGVAQRAKLKTKADQPHLLTMTATPIPRTVALTLYGELDISVIDALPPGRLPVKTYLVPPEKRDACYRWIAEQVKQHRTQVFFICPLIEESDQETLASVRAANQEYKRLKQQVFPQLRLGLIHGRLKAREKQAVMQTFYRHQLDILVATAVVEVGIDVPNASVMVIEGAQRYGLAQLHQLRGRVGRGHRQSYCYLFGEFSDRRAKQRLGVFCSQSLGLTLAEYDLRARGAGTLFGQRQHGRSELKIASFSDFRLIDQCHQAVNHFLLHHHDLKNFPLLTAELAKLKSPAMVGRD